MVPQAIPLLAGIDTGAVIAGKGYESNRILTFIRSTGARVLISPKSNRKEPWEYNRELYRKRNLIERTFNKLKHWRRIAPGMTAGASTFSQRSTWSPRPYGANKLSIRPTTLAATENGAAPFV